MTARFNLKVNPQDVLRNVVAERKESSSERFLSCVEVAENGLRISEGLK